MTLSCERYLLLHFCLLLSAYLFICPSPFVLFFLERSLFGVGCWSMRRNLSDGELIAAFIRSTILSSNLIQLYSERVDRPVTMRQLFALLYLLFQTTNTSSFRFGASTNPGSLVQATNYVSRTDVLKKLPIVSCVHRFHCKLRTSFWIDFII